MSETPSKRRRKGRDAFYNGADPGHLNPYKNVFDRRDWYAGFVEARCEYERKQREEIEISSMRTMPISYAIDQCNASESVKEILRRIAEHVGLTT